MNWWTLFAGVVCGGFITLVAEEFFDWLAARRRDRSMAEALRREFNR